MLKKQKPWDMRVDEPAKVYALFLLYRSMGVGRKLRDVAMKAGVKEATLVKVAQRFAWSFRADQWDAWALTMRSHSAEKRVLREADLEARTVSDLIRMTRTLVRRTLRDVNARARDKEGKPLTNVDGSPAFKHTLTPAGAANLGDVVVKLSRLARGESTDRRENISKQVRERVSEKIDRVAKILSERVKQDSKPLPPPLDAPHKDEPDAVH